MFESSLSQILLGAAGSLLAAGILAILIYLRGIHAQLKELPSLRLDVKALEKTSELSEKRIAENEKRQAENQKRYDEHAQRIAENAQRIAENEAKHTERMDAFEATQQQLVGTVNTLVSKVEHLESNMTLILELLRERTSENPIVSEQD